MMALLAQNLRDTSCRLGFWLDSLALESGQPVRTTPETMAGLLSELLRAGEWLRAEPQDAKSDDPELQRELARYRGQVERLRDVLPSIHSQLLAERARLESERNRVQSAAEWARSSRQTL
jgi:hypothetical protein